jgi:hypothetical protein
MLDMFKVSHLTDGKTECSIFVEPRKKRCDVMVKIDRIIFRMANETDPSFRSVGSADWSSVEFWERRASDLAKTYSPFWRGQAAS